MAFFVLSVYRRSIYNNSLTTTGAKAPNKINTMELIYLLLILFGVAVIAFCAIEIAIMAIYDDELKKNMNNKK